MLGVLPKSQGIANKKDDLAKREVIFLFLVFFFIMYYLANLLEHLPNKIFVFCSNFAVY